ncbi:MAG: sigma-70 family RNA polymerase sigma factor, partial [Bacilli bacterium]|nr:sigma-70 family RNA polymerase sigma factor [Bacilli bacterium]
MFNQENILANYLHEVNRYPKLTSFEEFWLFQKYNAGDENAKKFLIECNLRLVLLRVKKYYKSSEFMDIVQEGNLGLIKAIEKYEITKGKFSTFAISYIDGYIKNYFNNDKNQLYISNNLRLAVERYKKLVLLYNQEGKSIPDDKELCTLLSISLKQIQQVKKIVNFSFVRLNDLNKDGKENESFISDNEIFSDQLSKQKELLIGLKMLLKPYHYYIIYHRYLTSPKVKLHVLAETLGVKGESVRIGEVNALKELKNYMKNDQEIFESKLYKLQQKEGKLFNKINTRPVHPADITKFLYAKNHLNELEQKLFKLIYFGKYCFNEIEAASFLKIPFETYQDLFRALELKLQDIFEDHMQYESFHRQMVDQHKSKIFSLNLDAKVIDKNYLNSSYENFSFE